MTEQDLKKLGKDFILSYKDEHATAEVANRNRWHTVEVEFTHITCPL